jgi:hypothetical protein
MPINGVGSEQRPGQLLKTHKRVWHATCFAFSIVTTKAVDEWPVKRGNQNENCDGGNQAVQA